MNVLNSNEVDFKSAKQAQLMQLGLEELRAFSKSAAVLRDALTSVKSLGNENTERRVDRLLRQLDSFEPSVTMIGQIKSGKTTLVNALIGSPDLLPADVNPWTSVVTSLHLYPEENGFSESATFKFFDTDEWDKLVSGGGRIGELASRAGADAELEKIKEQVAQMREKSRARLGRKFEVLLGQQRAYGYFDKDLIERYVCLGEEPDLNDGTSGGDDQGRFADITKSADLSTQRSWLPARLCIRDTPGVNDTFMMREQITIRAIRDSKICVVVLSAHQALTSTDLALIRLITHVKSRDVIIFVNRVDELSDPASQVPEIRKSIARTLASHKGPEGAQVVFGSALCARAALTMRLGDLPQTSFSAMTDWAAFDTEKGHSATSPEDVSEVDVWQMSGIPELQAAICRRITEGVGAALLQKVGSSAYNIVNGLVAADLISVKSAPRRVPNADTADKARQTIQDSIKTQSAGLQNQFDDLLAAFADRLERVQESFLDRATASLLVHLETHGDAAPWTYDPTGLRVLLSSSHKVLARKSQAAFEAAIKSAASQIAKIYLEAFGIGPGELQILLPRSPQIAAPVSLGRTIALDLNSSWWKRWWLQRRGYKAYASSFHDLIKSETDPVISELRDDLARNVAKEACMTFDTFLQEQFSVFETLERMYKASPDELRAYVVENSPKERQALMQKTMETLKEYAVP